MDSELSLFVANQAKANESSLILDPFVGTGSQVFVPSYHQVKEVY